MSNERVSNDPLSRRILTELDREAENLTPETIRALRDIRNRAVQKHRHKTGILNTLRDGIPGSTGKWLGGMGLASAMLVLFFIVHRFTPQPESPLLLSSESQRSMQTMTTDEMELYEQLDFFLWLQEVSEDHEQLS